MNTDLSIMTLLYSLILLFAVSGSRAQETNYDYNFNPDESYDPGEPQDPTVSRYYSENLKEKYTFPKNFKKETDHKNGINLKITAFDWSTEKLDHFHWLKRQKERKRGNCLIHPKF